MKKPQNHFDLHHYQQRDYFGEVIGYQLVAKNPRKRTTRSQMKVKRIHISAAGRIHGGALMAFMDFACGSVVFLSMAPGDRTATIEIKSHFFSQIFEGQILEARASLHFRGNRIAVAECQVFDQKSGDKVALALGTYNILAEKRSEPKALDRRDARSSGRKAPKSASPTKKRRRPKA